MSWHNRWAVPGHPGVDDATRARVTPGDASTGANRSGSRCLIKPMAQGSRPRRSRAFKDAVVPTFASVEDQAYPMAVQLGVGLTDSPPLSLEEGVQITRCLAFQHVVDRPRQFMREDGQGFPLAVLFLQSGQQFLTGRIIPQE